MVKARECDLDKVKREDIEVTELICGTNDPKLREEILKMKDPKLVDIVALGHQFDTAAKLQKSNFNDDETKVNKTTSEYKKSQMTTGKEAVTKTKIQNADGVADQPDTRGTNQTAQQRTAPVLDVEWKAIGRSYVETVNKKGHKPQVQTEWTIPKLKSTQKQSNVAVSKLRRRMILRPEKRP